MYLLVGHGNGDGYRHGYGYGGGNGDGSTLATYPVSNKSQKNINKGKK
jgi:hypothetical protein